jgi:hypothetical protein
VQHELPVLALISGDTTYVDRLDRYSSLRDSEKAIFELNTDGYVTRIAYDQKYESVQNALFSIYTTSFIIVLLVVSIRGCAVSPVVLYSHRSLHVLNSIFLLTLYLVCRAERTSSPAT